MRSVAGTLARRPAISALDVAVASVSAVVGVLLVAVQDLPTSATIICGSLLLLVAFLRLAASGFSWWLSWWRCEDCRGCREITIQKVRPSEVLPMVPSRADCPNVVSEPKTRAMTPNVLNSPTTVVVPVSSRGAPSINEPYVMIDKPNAEACGPTRSSTPGQDELSEQLEVARRELELARTQEKRSKDVCLQHTAKSTLLARQLELAQAQQQELHSRLELAHKHQDDLRVLLLRADEERAELRVLVSRANIESEELRTEISHADFEKAELRKVISHAEDEKADGIRQLSNVRNEWLTARKELETTRSAVDAAATRECQLENIRRARTALALRLATRLWTCRSELQLARATGPLSNAAPVSPEASAPAKGPLTLLRPETAHDRQSSDHDNSVGVSLQKSSPIPSSAAEALRVKLEHLVMDNAYLKESLRAVRGVTGDETSDLLEDSVCSNTSGTKETILARLTRLAAQNASLKEQLRVAQAERATELLQQPSQQRNGCRLTSAAASPRCVGQKAAKPSTPEARTETHMPATESFAARDEVIARLTTVASAYAELRKEMAELASKHYSEVASLKAECEVAAQRTKEAEDKLASLRRAVARDALKSMKGRPQLSLCWSDGFKERWPHGPGSARGAEDLRKFLEGQSAQLTVGPPPNDWRTWLQLGLHRGEPSHPALLQLTAPDADGGPYVGLMWSAPAA